MTTYTEEEVAKMVSDAVERAKNAERIVNYGNIFFTMSLEYVADQVKRGIVPQQVLHVGEICYREFVGNASVPKPAQEQPEEPTAPQ